MKRRATLVAAAVSAAAVLSMGGTAGAASDGPTCSDSPLGIAVHGQHIVGDYVTGIGHDHLDWPPAGGVVGDAMQGGGGVAVAGGPGPGFHFPNDYPPGASFCVDSAQSSHATEHQQATR